MACLNPLAVHGSPASAGAGCGAAVVLAVAAAIAFLQLWDRPKFLFPSDEAVLARVADRIRKDREKYQQGPVSPEPPDPEPNLPVNYSSCPWICPDW